MPAVIVQRAVARCPPRSNRIDIADSANKRLAGATDTGRPLLKDFHPPLDENRQAPSAWRQTLDLHHQRSDIPHQTLDGKHSAFHENHQTLDENHSGLSVNHQALDGNHPPLDGQRPLSADSCPEVDACAASVDFPRFQELDVREAFLRHLQVDPVGCQVDVVAVAVEGHVGG